MQQLSLLLRNSIDSETVLNGKSEQFSNAAHMSKKNSASAATNGKNNAGITLESTFLQKIKSKSFINHSCW